VSAHDDDVSSLGSTEQASITFSSRLSRVSVWQKRPWRYLRRSVECELLARLLLESITADRRSNEEIRLNLNARLSLLESGQD
jgi:hypothetical protein